MDAGIPAPTEDWRGDRHRPVILTLAAPSSEPFSAPHAIIMDTNDIIPPLPTASVTDSHAQGLPVREAVGCGSGGG